MKRRLADSALPDNRLAFLDQAAFLRFRATGFDTAIQYTWTYDRPVDLERVRRFNRNLGHGLLGRRIERSPLPFGRHRWVAYHEPHEIDIAETPRPRAELGDWLDERGCLPVDPEHGPGWRIGVLNFDCGGSAVTLAASHVLVDGLGLRIAIQEAIAGETRDFGYPPPGSRTRLKALLIDACDTVRGLPKVLMALIASIVLLAKRGREPEKPVASTTRPAPTGPTENIVLPALTVLLKRQLWDSRALHLGGTATSLLVAFAARLAALMGRVTGSDGAAIISMPVSERTPDDTRGNALTALNFAVEAGNPTADLQAIRNSMKQGLAALQSTPNELLKPLPLIPLTPMWLARKMEGLAMGSSDLPTGCSNLGDLGYDIGNLDGANAEMVFVRTSTQGLTRQRIEAGLGELFLVSGSFGDTVYVSVRGYQPGIENSRKSLRVLITQTLSDFGLEAIID